MEGKPIIKTFPRSFRVHWTTWKRSEAAERAGTETGVRLVPAEVDSLLARCAPGMCLWCLRIPIRTTTRTVTYTNIINSMLTWRAWAISRWSCRQEDRSILVQPITDRLWLPTLRICRRRWILRGGGRIRTRRCTRPRWRRTIRPVHFCTATTARRQPWTADGDKWRWYLRTRAIRINRLRCRSRWAPTEDPSPVATSRVYLELSNYWNLFVLNIIISLKVPVCRTFCIYWKYFANYWLFATNCFVCLMLQHLSWTRSEWNTDTHWKQHRLPSRFDESSVLFSATESAGFRRIARAQSLALQYCKFVRETIFWNASALIIIYCRPTESFSR